MVVRELYGLGTGRATYPSTIPIVTSHVSRYSQLQAHREIAYPMAQARVGSSSACGDVGRLYVLAEIGSQYPSNGDLIDSLPQGTGRLPISEWYSIPLCSSLCGVSVVDSLWRSWATYWNRPGQRSCSLQAKGPGRLHSQHASWIHIPSCYWIYQAECWSLGFGVVERTGNAGGR